MRSLQSTFLLVAFLSSWSGSLLAASFVRGDADGNGVTNVADSVRVLRFLFDADPRAVDCEDALDVDDDGALGVTDVVFLLHYLFLRGPSPQAPYPACGDDTTEDELTCERFEPCLVRPGPLAVPG